MKADPKAAASLYEKAAEQGFAEAQFALGSCLAKGLGVETDTEKAKLWLGKASEQGHEEAKALLESL